MPTIYPDAQQVELADGVYDFPVGLYQASMSRMPRPESSCCAFWPAERFEQLTFHEHTLHFLEEFCTRRTLEFCSAFGALALDFPAPIVAPLGPPALYAYGPTGAGKSTILDVMLTRLLSEDLIGLIERLRAYNSRFQLADLLNCWIGILNDFSFGSVDHSVMIDYII